MFGEVEKGWPMANSIRNISPHLLAVFLKPHFIAAEMDSRAKLDPFPITFLPQEVSGDKRAESPTDFTNYVDQATPPDGHAGPCASALCTCAI